MNAIAAYSGALLETLNRAFDTQADALREGARLLKEATLGGRNIFAFGCSHAILPMLEMYYRTGGMATINPVRAPGLCLDVDPATMTSAMERMRDYGRVIVDGQPLGAGDVIIVHSVSGRNSVSIDVALRAKEKGAKVIVLTNLAMSRAVTSRHPDGVKLYEVGDVVIDNCGCLGDAAIDVPGVPEKVAPTSFHRCGRGHAQRHDGAGRGGHRGRGRRAAGVRLRERGRRRRAQPRNAEAIRKPYFLYVGGNHHAS